MTKTTLTAQQAMRYHRQILLPKFDLDKQELLLNAHVLVVGLGGLGCAAAQYLAASGVGQFTLVDDDQVDSSNLQRQVLHGETDIGRHKCDSAQASLLNLNAKLQIQSIKARLTMADYNKLLPSVDLVLDCTDNLASRNLLNQVCYQQQKNLVSGAAIRMEGQLICVQPKTNSACYACISQFITEQNLTCVEAGIMSPVVGVIGSMQALEAIKLLTGYGQSLTNTLMLFDGIQGQWQSFTVAKHPECKICSG
ncbi:molybdopterin-synthase adenylyltransferase MoeB [Paraglaciecola aestuariivivens]